MDQYQPGHASYRPNYTIDSNGKLIPLFPTADAVSPAAKPGAKAGNPLLDEAMEQIRQRDNAEKMKRLYRTNKE